MDNEEKQMQFAITRILDCGFQVEEAILGELTAELGYGMNLAYSIAESWVQLNIRADFRHPKSGIIFLTGTVLTKFAIKDLKNFIGEDGVVNFTPNSLETFFSIAFGHMRAILSKNCAGSKFATLIVPSINPITLFQELFISSVEYTTKMYNELGIDITGKKAIELFDITLAQKHRDKKSAELDTSDVYDNLVIKETKKRIDKLKK